MSATVPRCTPFAGRAGPFGYGGIAIVARIGKDDAADGTMLLRELWLRRAW